MFEELVGEPHAGLNPAETGLRKPSKMMPQSLERQGSMAA